MRRGKVESRCALDWKEEVGTRDPSLLVTVAYFHPCFPSIRAPITWVVRS
jgi:hypothetical protein